MAFGGYVAFSVYLPTYLKTGYLLTAADAANKMAGFVLVAVVMRPIGGWLSDRVHPARVLTVAFAVVALAALVQSATPSLVPVGTIAFLVMAAALGTASGAVFALVAQRAPVDRVGAVTGLVGAAGGLGGFVPPLVMGAVYGRYGSYATGLDRAHRRRSACLSARRPDRPPPGRNRSRAVGEPTMCEYCGCKQNEVIAELTAEHDRIRELSHDLTAAVNAADPPAACRLASQMRTVLGPHTEVEEAALFPALAADFGDQVGELVTEHRDIDAALGELETGRPGPGWELRTHLAARSPLRPYPQRAGRRLSGCTRHVDQRRLGHRRRSQGTCARSRQHDRVVTSRQGNADVEGKLPPHVRTPWHAPTRP